MPRCPSLRLSVYVILKTTLKFEIYTLVLHAQNAIFGPVDVVVLKKKYTRSVGAYIVRIERLGGVAKFHTSNRNLGDSC